MLRNTPSGSWRRLMSRSRSRVVAGKASAALSPGDRKVYGLRPPGNLKARSTAYLSSWSEERGIDPMKPATINAALGVQMRRELRQQIMKRTVRNLPNLMPFLVGAAVGAAMNRRDTQKLAARIRADLRRMQVPWDELPQLPPLERPAQPLEMGDLVRPRRRGLFGGGRGV